MGCVAVMLKEMNEFELVVVFPTFGAVESEREP
jgi:hypothetical protein